jgi:arylsulfatase A
VGCYGSDYHETPNIDRLAAEGMRFTDAYAAAAVCSPTRASIMTGKYPARVGITDWIRARFQGGAVPADGKNPSGYQGDEQRKLLTPVNPLWMELDEITIAEVLKEAGYACGHVGKWHLGLDDWFPEKQGFYFNAGGCDYGEPPSFFDPYVRKADENWIEKETIAGIPTLKPRKAGEYLTDREADEAVRFIRANSGKPFYLNMCPYAVHFPIQAKKELIDKYRAKSPGTHHRNPIYAAMIESVDQAVGKIMSTLDELNVEDRTVVIFTSDNGGITWWDDMKENNLPLRDQKGTPYEGGIRVPLIVKWPGEVEAGNVCHEPVLSVDFFPTICQMAEVRPPADRVIDGRSLVPLLKKSGSLNREAIFWHFPHYRGRAAPYSIMRAGDWKLIRFYEDNRLELYNLKNDLSEKNDVAGQFPERVKRMNDELSNWLLYTKAKMPKPNPHYDTSAQEL